MNKEVDLSVSCLGKVKELKYDVIILPWGCPLHGDAARTFRSA